MPRHPSFQPGDVVWAHVDGYPWWPSYITIPEPGHLRALKIRSIPPGYHLVWFFCDNDRFSLMTEGRIRAWKDDNLQKRALTFKGHVRRAYNEAVDWIETEERRVQFLEYRWKQERERFGKEDDQEDEDGRSHENEGSETSDKDLDSDLADDIESDAERRRADFQAQSIEEVRGESNSENESELSTQGPKRRRLEDTERDYRSESEEDAAGVGERVDDLKKRNIRSRSTGTKYGNIRGDLEARKRAKTRKTKGKTASRST